MFRMLFKLFAYGLVGYCIYEFFRGASGTEIGQKAREMGREMFGGEEGEEAGRGQRSFRDEPSVANMTGPGEGTTVETHDADGGSVPVRVGRGVRVARGAGI